MKKQTIVATGSKEAFEERVCQFIEKTVHSIMSRHGLCRIGLSGGSTPQAIYKRLGESRTIDWRAMFFFLVDERYVPESHPDSNQHMVRSTILMSAPIPPEQIIFPDTSLPIAGCVDDYAEKLKAVLPAHFVILGLGTDGHIASLFPPLTMEAYGPQRVIHTTTDHFTVHDRITVTLPVLNTAEHRLFLLCGKEKEDLLEKMLAHKEDVTQYPAHYLFDEKTTWIVGP